ncbi:MAG: site-specific DNA-methyltransferase, partial [Clostridia bacterium]|nr:site-specific DNA-methyltransferase [Clostridia bacterium]
TKENLIELVNNFVPECIRVSKRLAIFTGITNAHIYPNPEWMMCYKWNTTGSFGFYGYNQWQPVLLYGKDIKGFGNVNGIIKSDVMEFSGGNGVGFLRDNEKEIHCCPKPKNVIEGFLKRLSNENELVLDCFSGSGTTAVACHRLNRRFICIEKDKEYWEASVKRLEDERKQLSLFGGNE